MFKLISHYQPNGDQPRAIKALVEGLHNNKRDQVLLGVTGSGKTFTMANVISNINRPALIMAHNKTLAAQLYKEMQDFFPENSVQYFVSYYDYYQPEAYVATTDTYIEKDATINDTIDKMRHSATRALLERRDVIVVSSVSCIYGIGSPSSYYNMVHSVKIGDYANRDLLFKKLISLQYERNDIKFERGSFRARGNKIDILPAHSSDYGWRIILNIHDIVENIFEFDAITGEKTAELNQAVIFANSHYVTDRETINRAIEHIKIELKERIQYFRDKGDLIAAQRIQQRTEYDIEMLIESGICKGIENYSRYLTGREAGYNPPTLFEYLPKDALVFVDESHVTVPQIGAMYLGDRARKQVLVDHGFRLPSALDNRPLKFEEWESHRGQTIFVSATPGKFELEIVKDDLVEQVIRPTGLIDPECIIRPCTNQVDDLINESRKIIAKKQVILVTTLTKKMAEHLTNYMHEIGFKVSYLHSDVKTLDRIEILNKLKKQLG